MFAYSAGWLPNANGRVEKGLTHITDIIPTFVGLAGGSLTGSNGKLDGYDIWPTIGAASPRRASVISNFRACFHFIKVCISCVSGLAFVLLCFESARHPLDTGYARSSTRY